MIKNMKKMVFLVSWMFLANAYGKDSIKTISIDELDNLIKTSPQSIHLYDANVESTRTHVGIIQGAQLIDSSGHYDPARVLPKEKDAKLIFYCANEMCTSSHQAAKQAVDAGYSDVSVMKQGIYGWKKAGKTVVALNQTPPPESTTSPVEPKEADSLVKKNQAIIVDVREDEERHEVIAGSTWMPMSKASDSDSWSAFLKQLPKDKTVIFHCAAGFRSKKLAEKLAHEGHKSLYFKGVDQWKEAGLPLTKGPAQ